MKLEDIQIAKPCPASWEQMYGDDRVRYCNICAKNVYNLSQMTRTEAQLLINTDAKLCARIFVRKDGSVMTSDCEVGLRAIRKVVFKRLAGVAAMVLALITSISLSVMNQRLTAAVNERMIPVIAGEQQLNFPEASSWSAVPVVVRTMGRISLFTDNKQR